MIRKNFPMKLPTARVMIFTLGGASAMQQINTGGRHCKIFHIYANGTTSLENGSVDRVQEIKRRDVR